METKRRLTVGGILIFAGGAIADELVVSAFHWLAAAFVSGATSVTLDEIDWANLLGVLGMTAGILLLFWPRITTIFSDYRAGHSAGISQTDFDALRDEFAAFKRRHEIDPQERMFAVNIANNTLAKQKELLSMLGEREALEEWSERLRGMEEHAENIWAQIERAAFNDDLEHDSPYNKGFHAWKSPSEDFARVLESYEGDITRGLCAVDFTSTPQMNENPLRKLGDTDKVADPAKRIDYGKLFERRQRFKREMPHLAQRIRRRIRSLDEQLAELAPQHPLLEKPSDKL